jgi:nucleotide-binding universal stress UspA family protein
MHFNAVVEELIWTGAMQDLFELEGVDKPPKLTRIVIETVGALIGISGEERETGYKATLNALLSDFDTCIARFQAVNISSISNVVADKLFTTTSDPNFVPEAAQSETIKELCEMLIKVMDRCLGDISRKPILQQKFLVAVDGSRMSYAAFDVACRLRGYGSLHICHIDDPTKNYLPAHLTPSYMKFDFEQRCVGKGVPLAKSKFIVQSKDEGVHTRSMILKAAEKNSVDYLILGAFGRKGPSIFQIGSVTDWSVRSSPLTTIIVKPQSTIPEGVKPAMFVVAVDLSATASAAVTTALTLMKPTDQLRILHIDVEENDPDGYKPEKAEKMIETFTSMLEMALVDGAVVKQEKQPGKTISQQICAFTEESGGHFLFIGIDGMGAWLKGQSALGSVSEACVQDARCTTIICKEQGLSVVSQR